MKRKLAGLLAGLALLGAAAPRAGEGGEAPPPAWRKLLGADEWGGVYAAGRKVGYMHSRARLVQKDGRETVAFDESVLIRTKYMNLTMEISGKSHHEYSAETGELLLLTAQTAMNGRTITDVKVTPEGKAFKLSTTVGGQEQSVPLPACKHNLESVLAGQLLATRPGAKVGDSNSGEMLMPETGQAVRTVNTIKRRRTMLFRGVVTKVADIETRLFKLPEPGIIKLQEPGEDAPGEAPLAVVQVSVDSGGRMLEGQIMGTFTFRMESEAGARKMDAVSDIMLTTAVPLGEPLPGARRSRKAVLKITGLPRGSVSDTSRQRLEKAGGGHKLTLTVDERPGKTAPLSGDEREKLAGHLKATPYLQSGDPRIRKLAAEVLAGETDPYKAACRLNAWVFVSIAKKFTPMISNALDTLESRQGDCGEHAALMTALCRAAGVPAREVAGLAYAAYGGRGVLGGHAWVEVYAGGRWIAMDPTLGQEIADALHIKVAEGGMSGMDGMIRLANLMSKIKVEVLSVE